MGIESFDDFMETHGEEIALEQNKLRQSLNSLKQRLEADPTGVSLDEIIQGGMGNCFELNSSSDFLNDNPWLIKALPFTSRPISNEEIPIAWERFLKENLSEESIGFLGNHWPILECIAGWYVSHWSEPGYDGNEMVRRALAVFEYLIKFLYGTRLEECYSEVLTGNGLTILYGYCGLKNFERAKFYAQLLGMEYLAGRLDSEDYLDVKKNYDHLLKLGHEDRASIDNKILDDLQWQTISDREKRIEELEEHLDQIISREKNQVNLQKAEKKLEEQFGATWKTLNAETRKQLRLAMAFAYPPISKEHPFVTPWSFYRAINSELLVKLFKPYGPLDRKMLNEVNGTSPISLLINYGRRKFAVQEPEIHSFVKDALARIGHGNSLLTVADLKCLQTLRQNRNEAEHPDPQRPYTETDMKNLLRDVVWYKDWLTNWLKRINQTA